MTSLRTTLTIFLLMERKSNAAPPILKVGGSIKVSTKMFLPMELKPPVIRMDGSLILPLIAEMSMTAVLSKVFMTNLKE